MKKLLIAIVILVAFGQNCCSNQRNFPARSLPNKISYLRHIVELNLESDGMRGLCTGVVVDESGLIATAAHCVDDGAKVFVKTAAGKWPAAVLGTDEGADVALVAIKGWNFRPIELCPSDVDVDAGVCAVGRTFDNYLFEFECGDTTAVNGEMIVTTTKIRPGFSGGPLIDIDRECLAGITHSRISYASHFRAYHAGLTALKRLIKRFK